MATKKKQLYIVVHGYQPGVYSRWFGVGGAAEQVDGFTDPIFRGFYTHDEAVEWLGQFDRETLGNLAPNLLAIVDSAPQEAPAERQQELLESGKVLIYTDGAATGNPGPGGYGIVLRHKHSRKELSAGFRLTTNNRMELMACIEGLSALKHPCEVILYSDSRYVVDNMTVGRAEQWRTAGWKRSNGQGVKNADLWRQLLESCDEHDVEFRWTRGHSGNPDNERCDLLATRAARGKRLAVDAGFESTR